MSERLNLEQLKAMSDEELEQAWRFGHWPFDSATDCVCCMTQHTFSVAMCREQNHQIIKTRCIELLRDDYRVSYDGVGRLRAHLEELYALRLFYDHLYPQPAVTPEAPVSENERMREDHYDFSAGTR